MKVVKENFSGAKPMVIMILITAAALLLKELTMMRQTHTLRPGITPSMPSSALQAEMGHLSTPWIKKTMRATFF